MEETAGQFLLKNFSQARKRLQKAQEAWDRRVKSPGPWLRLLDELKAAEREEEQASQRILTFIKTLP